MIRQLSVYLFIAGSIGVAALADVRPVNAANGAIAASMQAESPTPLATEPRIASLEETFPSVESAFATRATTRFEH